VSTGDEIQLVTFSVGGQEFGFNVFDVERVLRYEAPTPLPESPDYLEGTLRFGDDAVPIVDLRKRLELPSQVGEETRIVLLELDRGRVGLVVDAVLEVMKVPADRVRPPSQIVQGLAAEYITGIVSIAKRTLVLLAASRLLNSKESLTLGALTAELTDE
jgi:purine-binding chemotaxis protein CheW